MFDLTALLAEGPVFFDGGLGTELQAMGLAPGENPCAWNLSHPAEVLAVHRRYLAAGARIIEANTFGANRLEFPAQWREVVTAGVRLAKEAIRLEGLEGEAFAALDIGPTGRMLEPFGELPLEEAIALFREMAAAGAGEGAGLVTLETFTDTQEARAAVIAAKEAAPGLPLLCSLTFEANGRLLSGATPQAAAAILEGMGVQALGVNCGAGPERARQVLPGLLERARVPVIANPNAGLPRMEDGRAVYDLSPENFALQCEELLRMGASLLGGCCGTAPAHIAALHARLEGKAVCPPQNGAEDCIASPREVIPLSQADPEALKEYDPEEPSFEPVKITGDQYDELEMRLRGYNGRALVVAPEWARPLVEKYGGVLAG
jgi:5-methyltetrahydrofolate--homocysteine methyltransferase